jgi:hypothetical protein
MKSIAGLSSNEQFKAGIRVKDSRLAHALVFINGNPVLVRLL